MDTATRLVDRAYEAILALVGSGKVGDQDTISFRDLSERLGMSRMPITVALDRLKREGVVESHPRMGTRICRIDAESIWGLLRWRIALECEIASEAAQWMSASERRRLVEFGVETDAAFVQVSPIAGRYIEALKRRDAGESDASAILEGKMISPAKLPYNVDQDFHFLLADLCRSMKLRHEIDRALSMISVKVAICEAVAATASRAIPPKSPPNHETLAQVIAEGNPREASDCMRRHIENGFFIYGYMKWYRSHYFDAHEYEEPASCSASLVGSSAKANAAMLPGADGPRT